MCNIVHTCIKKYTVAVLYSCKFCTARVFLFLADHEAIQFTNILKIRRYLCADEAKGLLVPYVLVAVRRGSTVVRSTLLTAVISLWILPTAAVSLCLQPLDNPYRSRKPTPSSRCGLLYGWREG